MKKAELDSFIAAVKSIRESATDEQAVEAVGIYPVWHDGMNCVEGKRLQYDGKLYRVRQTHTAQAQYPPSIDTAALYTEVEKPGQGDTPNNPIPYNNNMELFEGKYYSQDGVTYICFRSTGTAVYNPLSALVNIYVRVYEG
jgi:hypothetical protein